MTEPAVGASTCASGNQVCSGKSGTLMAKAMKKARNSQNSSVLVSGVRAGLNRAQNRRVVETAAADPQVQIDDRDQHQHRTGHGVQEEFDRGVNAPVVSPDADEEVHRDQADFPEHVEQEQVVGGEHADQTEFEQQQERVEFFGTLLDGAPRNHDGHCQVVGGSARRRNTSRFCVRKRFHFYHSTPVGSTTPPLRIPSNKKGWQFPPLRRLASVTPEKREHVPRVQRSMKKLKAKDADPCLNAVAHRGCREEDDLHDGRCFRI